MSDFTYEHTIKTIGQTVSLEFAVRLSTSMLLRLLVGVVGNLPPNALAVNAAVAFGLSAALEVPTGIVADTFGKINSVRLGCFLQAMASISIFGAIIFASTEHIGLMWGLIILEAVFDALGNSFMSGAREALYQDLIETNSIKFEKLNYLWIVEKYGRLTPSILSFTFIGAALFLDRSYSRAHWVVPFLAVSWLFLARKYSQLWTLCSQKPAPFLAIRFRSLGFLSQVQEGLKHLIRIQGAGCIVAYVLIQFFSSLLQTYFFVMAARKYSGGTTIYLLTAALVSARLLRTYVVPAFPSWFHHSNQQARVSSFILLFWCIALFCFSSFWALMFLSICLDSVVGIVSRPTVILLLDGIPPSVRATIMSFFGLLVLLFSSGFSWALSFTPLGLPTFAQIAIVGAVVAFLLAGLSIRSSLVSIPEVD